MTEAVIVAPGPSAALFEPADWPGATVCAVNRGASNLDERGIEYDWFCALDTGTYTMFQPRPTVGVICSDKIVAAAKPTWRHWSDDLTVYDPDNARAKDGKQYSCWSSTCAVACIAKMGYSTIIMYGMDWDQDCADWDGAKPGMRDSRRWAHERSILESIMRRNPQASFRRITMQDEQINDEPTQEAEEAKPKRGRKKAAVPKAVEPEPFRPFTFSDIAVNKVGACLEQIAVPNQFGQAERVSTLEQVASLDKFQAGAEIDWPISKLAFLLGPRGSGAKRRTGYMRAAEVVAEAQRMLKVNRANEV